MDMIMYQGRYYLYEAEATATNVKANAIKMLNKLLVASKPTSTTQNTSNTKEDLRLFGTSLEDMDLWDLVVAYFDTFANSELTKETISSIHSNQEKIIQLVMKMSEEFVTKYRNANVTIIRTGSKKTTNDYIYRYVRNVYIHYFYFVGLYNLRFSEYLQGLVSSGQLFNKKFNVNFNDVYDPPRMTYYKNGYLDTQTNSDFNKNKLDKVEWDNELDSKTETVTTGFPKSKTWDFSELIKIYENGLPIKNSSPPIIIRFSSNPKLQPYIKEIENTINDIVNSIKYNLNELSANIIAKNSKNAEKNATVIATNKEDIKNKVSPISKPYNTKDEYDAMDKKFRGIDHEENKKAVEDVSKFTKKGDILKKRRGTWFNGKEK